MHIKLKDKTLSIEAIAAYLKEHLQDAACSYLKRNIVIDNRDPDKRPSAILIAEQLTDGARAKIFLYSGDIHIKTYPKFPGLWKFLTGGGNTANNQAFRQLLVNLLMEKYGGTLIKQGLG